MTMYQDLGQEPPSRACEFLKRAKKTQKSDKKKFAGDDHADGSRRRVCHAY